MFFASKFKVSFPSLLITLSYMINNCLSPSLTFLHTSLLLRRQNVIVCHPDDPLSLSYDVFFLEIINVWD